LDYPILATDGEIGRASDFYLDDERWVIRYLVVIAGSWLNGRSVLISPMAITRADWDSKQIHVALTKEQVMNSPGSETHQPVSRQWEAEYSAYYRWPYYWTGPGLWGAWPTPGGAAAAPYAVPAVPPSVAGEIQARLEQEKEENHLRSVQEVIGYAVLARDGEAGRVEDFLVDDESWAIRQIMVDTTSWWPGGEVLVGPEHAESVDWPRGEIAFDLSREDIRSRPEFRPSGPTAH
jgi:hypothetical protein